MPMVYISCFMSNNGFHYAFMLHLALSIIIPIIQLPVKLLRRKNNYALIFCVIPLWYYNILLKVNLMEDNAFPMMLRLYHIELNHPL